jgi:hypothetical protein
LAQDWARLAKGLEKGGEAIAEFILLTGQNPRKLDQQPATNEKFLLELADGAMSYILAIQHFTKDTAITDEILTMALRKAAQRVLSAHRRKVADAQSAAEDPFSETLDMLTRRPEDIPE